MPSANAMPCCHPPRRAAVRPAHLCRGRGGRGCRCHADARKRLARPILAGNGHALRWRPSPDDPPPVMRVLHDPPQRPQAPPLPV